MVGINGVIFTARGKEFEKVLSEQIKQYGVFIQRIYDCVDYRALKNLCDYYAYRCPYLYLLEMKTTAGASLPFANISETQWGGLLEASKYDGIIAGFPIWFYNKDTTKFISIQEMEKIKNTGVKSVRYDTHYGITINGTKRRVYWDYEISKFFTDAENRYGFKNNRIYGKANCGC